MNKHPLFWLHSIDNNKALHSHEQRAFKKEIKK